MRNLINLIESIEDDEDDTQFDHLPSSAAIKALAPLLADAAQKQYDRWQVGDDEEGFDSEYAGGGICHLIASDVASVMDAHGIVCTTVSSSHEQHVYCVAQCSDGVFEVDVPWRNYETGGGFAWKRIDGVEFDASYISIYRITSDPAEFENYIDY